MTRRPCYAVIDAYLEPERARELAALIEGYAAAHDLPLIERRDGRRALHYRVIDGARVAADLEELVPLHAEVQQLAESIMRTSLIPMRNERARLNVNITPPGGSYRWHYDRNAVTALLYLNSVEGGALELCPGYRIGAGRRRVNRMIDRVLRARPLMALFGRRVAVVPAPGRLVVMRGDRCLHSVAAVDGGADRINVVMSFDDPRTPSSPGDTLDTYLYSAREVRSTDPNYRSRGADLMGHRTNPTDRAAGAGTGDGRVGRLVVMGVAGSGKTTVAREIAQRTNTLFVDADDLHTPESVAKMAAGYALDDADRAPWLARVCAALAATDQVVVACSALTRRARDTLREARAVQFVCLVVDEPTARRRVGARAGHFFGVPMVAGQFTSFEPPQPDELDVVVVDARSDLATVLATIDVPWPAVRPQP